MQKRKGVVWVTKSKLLKQTEMEVNRWLPDWVTEVVRTGKQVVSPFRDIVIISYDLVEKQLPNLVTTYDTVVMDEITMITNPNAKRSMACRTLCEDADSVIGISGTPIRGRPKNFWSFLNILDKEMFTS